MEDHYKFSRDAAESDRLRTQHKWMLAITGGFHIHPSIPATVDTPNLRIADVGTGTGIYLIDLASMLPASSQLHGFDISTAQYPPPEKLPKNVSLHQQDMRFPFKEEFIGTFDIVDVRLTCLGIRGDEWIDAVKNVTALLKPGGYIQWIEVDHSTGKLLHKTPGAPSAATSKLISIMGAWWGDHILPGLVHLPTLFPKTGLEIVARERYATDAEEKGAWPGYFTKMMTQSTSQLLKTVAVQAGLITFEEAEELLKNVAEEIKNGDIYQHSDIWVLVGKKGN